MVSDREKRARRRAQGQKTSVKLMRKALAKKKRDAVKKIHNAKGFPWKMSKAQLMVRFNA